MPASSDKNLPAIISDPADAVDERHFGVMGNEPRTSLEDAELDQAVEDTSPRNPAKQRATDPAERGVHDRRRRGLKQVAIKLR